MTGEATPYIGDVLNAAFASAQAVVVLQTPDDIAYLNISLCEAVGIQDPADARFGGVRSWNATTDHRLSHTSNVELAVFLERRGAFGEETPVCDLGNGLAYAEKFGLAPYLKDKG
jgi:hypothetical protein